MPRAVKRARQYDSTKRRAQARANRAAILAASRTYFLERGYTATTMSAIASEAGVSVETVYKAFENKAGLLAALFDTTLTGDDAPEDPDHELIRDLWEEFDPVAKLRGYAGLLARRGHRVQPVQLVARQAAESDAAAAVVYEQIRAQRLENTTLLANFLHESGHLRKGVSAEEARDVIWTYNSAELWDLLVIKRGWSPERYGRWIGDALVAALLE